MRQREDGFAGAISVSQTLLWQAGRDDAHGYHETSSRLLMDWRGVLLRAGIGAAELCGPARAARSAMKMKQQALDLPGACRILAAACVLFYNGGARHHSTHRLYNQKGVCHGTQNGR